MWHTWRPALSRITPVRGMSWWSRRFRRRSAKPDYFGNSFAFFTIQEPHEELKIEAHSRVVADGPSVPWPDRSPAWDEVVRTLRSDLSAAALDAYQFVFESPRVTLGDEFAEYATTSFSPGRPLTEALLDFTDASMRNFALIPSQPTYERRRWKFFAQKGGVVRTSLHFQVACLRSLGLPARYVSGYLRTNPPPGSRGWSAQMLRTRGYRCIVRAPVGWTWIPPIT